MTAAKKPEEMGCHVCQLRRKAEANPNGLMSRIWRWHTTWCPGWAAYQAALAAQDQLKSKA